MTKKHFIALADMLRDAKPEYHSQTLSPVTYEEGFQNGRSAEWDDLTSKLADFCADQNPRFDRQRWLGYIAGTNGKNGGQIKQG